MSRGVAAAQPVRKLALKEATHSMRFPNLIAILCGAILLATISLATLAAPAGAGEPGTAGFLSLRLGSGARASGMGEAQISLAEDATAVYWNPSGLAAIQGNSFTLQHNEWLHTVRISSAAFGHATDFGVFGLSFSGMYMDEIPKVETASGITTGNFNVYEVSVSGAWAMRFREVWDFGVALKGLNSKLDETSASGWAVDAGLRFHPKIEGLTFAAVAQHLGPDMTFIADPFKLPATARMGADYERAVAQHSRVILAYDLELANDAKDPRNHLGLEYTYQNSMSLRAGYKSGFESQGVTFGAGVRRAGYSFDYAYVDIANDLGNSHRFSLGIDL
jgi:long-subunit fatty acid transport protein